MAISPVLNRVLQQRILHQVDTTYTGNWDGIKLDALEDGIHLDFENDFHYTKLAGKAAVPAAFSTLFTCTGGDQGTVMGADGFLRLSAANTPRIDYSKGKRSLLIESTRANLALQSQDFSTTWTRSAVNAFGAGSVVNTIASPSGVTNADFIQEDTTAGASHYVDQAFTKAAASTTYSVTIFAKYNGRHLMVLFRDSASAANRAEIGVNLQTGAVGSAAAAFGTFSAASGTVTSLPNSWYKITLTFTTSTETGTILRLLLDNGSFTAGGSVYNGDNTSGVYLWGAQLEVGAFPSSYIPTTTIAVTRTSDRCIRTLSTEFNAAAGTFAIDATIINTVGATPAFFSVHNNTVTGAEEMIMYGNAGARRWFVTDGGVSQGNVLGNSITDGIFARTATAYAVNDLHMAVSGVLAASPDTLATLPTVTHLDLLRQDASAISFGFIRKFDYWPTRKDNSSLSRESAA